MIKEITSTIKYIGVDDIDLGLFESQYAVPNGISYNSYVIFDEKVAIMDTVDSRRGDEWKENLHEALAGRIPDYLIIHHMEPDHSALIKELVDRYPSITLVCSSKAVSMLSNFFDDTDLTKNTLVVKEKDTLCLGEHTLTFFAAPMVHWPEVMISYDSKDKILFSADAFGKFGVLSIEDDWVDEGRRYYINICGKYGKQVQSMMGKVESLDIEKICSLHGPMLAGNIEYYYSLYDTWSKYEVETEGVLVAYASIHGGTKAVAEYVAEQLRKKNAGEVAIIDLCRCDMAKAVEYAFRYSSCIFAASSYDSSLFPPMYEFIHKLQLKNWQNRRAAIIENGSWAPSAGRVMQQEIEKMKSIEIVEPQVTIWSRMKEADKDALNALIDAVIKK